ncbi:TonB-dependent receptor [Ekhidna sp. To15]|uniref:TonB-dependent receptor n=1 Tax=Ekhidna sp. To15 TaxID=3395267 RepID=UPI003F5226D9
MGFLRASLLIFFLASLQLNAQEPIKGAVFFGSEPFPGATVQLVGTSFGSISDANGLFTISDVPVGDYVLEIRSVGFKVIKREIKVPLRESITLELEESTLTMDEVVVTGTMQPTFVSQSPVKVEVVTAKHLNTYIPAAATSVVEGISLVNGVQEVVACGVCFTNSISINGLPGPYTAILMDGSPIYGNLASVYGLNGIPSMIIDRFEVIKGPSSTLYGSEAVAGVINIITKDPSQQPVFSADIMGTSHLESFGNFSLAPKIGKSAGFLGLNYAYINDFDDQNGDGFGDNINLDRISLFTKWDISRPSGKKFMISGKYYYEDRRNGVEEFLEDRNYRTLRGNDQIYGESIYTNRFEIFGTYAFNFAERIRMDYSLSTHEQDSYYGADYYQASQNIVFTNFIWDKEINRHQLTTGLTSRHQSYDDNTVATETSGENRPDNQYTPGVFVQDEFEVSKRFTALGGLRLDHYENHGFIPAPRLNLKYKPSDWTTLRSNFGTGFRIVNLFTEDHAFVTGQREVIIEEALQPEESYNFSLNLNHIYTIGQSQGMLDVDVYYTHFTNKITPDYENEGQIRYANTDGYAVSKGVGFNLQQELAFPLAFNLGFNIQEVTENEQGDTRSIEFAPKWTGILTANYNLKLWKMTIGYTARVTGPMALPLVFDLDENGDPLLIPRPTESEAFAIHNLQVSKDLSNGWSIYGGVQNIFDYVQPWSPLTGTNDPNTNIGFSDSFDTAYAYSPIHGREVYLGISWSLARN